MKTYLKASVALLIEPKLSLDQLIFEDGKDIHIFVAYFYFLDFEIKMRIVEESKKSLNLLEKCVTRAGELFDFIENEAEDVASLSSSNSHISSAGGSSPIRRKQSKAIIDIKSSANRKSPRGVLSDLSQVRKQFEKASLAEIIARQKRQQLSTPLATNITSIPATPKQSIRFNINLQMISELLAQRQDAISQLNSKLASLFDSKTESADDDIWRKTLRISISSSCGDLMNPIGPIIGLLSHPSHPISQISRDFVLRLKTMTNSVEDAQAISKQISEEYHQFSFQMIKLLRHNYEEELLDDLLELPLQISIESFMFSKLPGLGTGIVGVFSNANSQEDFKFLSHLTKLSWLNFDHEDALYTILSVPEKYQLSSSQYEPAVSELRHASSLTSPTSKALGIVKVCDLICSAIDKEFEEESSTIGSEDLVLLLSWVIVQAQVPNMITFFALISEFLPEELIRGQAGYVLATLQTCLDYIKSIH